ncbi:L,D-transpeptidase family protein [Aeromicrobium piscarium]|uniref:L,D-transpeptidase family protein n=1 Tax=Aeromicrobium piscarium TaxID=2590901 RepID=A0A554RNF2_9ACTN|nr:L,D-transpeptidase family protein [Aeromicrobium piscarium]
MSSFSRVVVAAVAALVLVGCSDSGASDTEPAAAAGPEPVLSANVTDGQTDVPVETIVTVDVEDGELGEVVVRGGEDDAVIEGTVDGARWTAAERLEPAVDYTLQATASGTDGQQTELETGFTSQSLTLDEQTYPSVAPLQGETVGVGMPVIVNFDLPVEDRATFEQHMAVTSEPQVEGAWNWISDRVVHWRPKEYWPAGTKVHVDLQLNSLPAGQGIYGQQNQVVDFEVGSSVVSTVDVNAHTLTVDIDGQTARTIPVSSGAPQWASREGTKIVMEKFDTIDMDAATTGVDSSDPNYYNMKGVKWAMRLTNSGEFIHAAPWSAGSHGRANVSHGCVGMGTEDAGWLYQNSKRGDVVNFVGSTRALEPQNGWTDWNVDWETWQSGSALAGA